MIDFLIIGTPKSGTTALQNYLSQHPEIFMPESKELHYFGSEFKTKRNQYTKNLSKAEYLNLFSKSSSSQLKGEASVFYLYSKDASEQIKKFNPNMKLIVCFRHPVDFLISYHQDALYVGNENEMNFWKALELESERKKGREIPTTTNFLKSLYYSELVNYTSHLKIFINDFGLENIKVVVFEEFIANTKKEYHNILDFLNVNDKEFTSVEFSKINPRRTIKNRSLNKILKTPPPFLRLLLRLIFPSQNLRLSIFKKVRLINTSYKKINNLTHKEKQDLQKEYYSNINDLEKLLKKDLSIWKNLYS